ncbi:MAG: acyltransferase [Dysgonomonas sp.]|nr:acyltransferase [Dysgonomonas sp.]
MRTQTVYFPNLNALRFIAAFVVIVHHMEQIKAIWGISYHYEKTILAGPLGVTLFFVLSGYLITYLLLVEERNTNTISIKDFYVRRVLRIWPLYYIIIGLAFLVLHKLPFFELVPIEHGEAFCLVLFLLFLPNVVPLFCGNLPYVSHTWSIGVEEQFYLIWPILMKFSKNKKYALFAVIIIYLGIKYILFPILNYYDLMNLFLSGIQSVWNYFYIDCMAIGGLFALMLYEKHKILKFLFSPFIKWGIPILTCILILYRFQLPVLHHEFYAVLFGIIILNMSANPKPPINLENKVLNYLGKISYGLYMYHPIAIVIIVKSLASLSIYNFFLQLFLCTALTVLFASLSYHLIEKRFIKLKTRFSKVVSGENAIKE